MMVIQKNKLGLKEWTHEEFEALSYCIGETCESSTSASSRLGVSNMELLIGKEKYEKLKEGQKTPLHDDVDNGFITDKLVPFMNKSITDCKQLVVGCIWSGDKTNCTHFFISSYSNFGGGMCSHNKMPEYVLRSWNLNWTIQSLLESTMDDEEISKWMNFIMDDYFFVIASNNETVWKGEVPLRQTVAGQSTGLTLVLASNPNDYECPQQDSDGVKFGVRSIISEPNVGKSGLVAPWGFETFVSVIPDVILADESIKDIEIKIRGCAFDGEIKLKYYTHYSRENCIQERLSDEIFSTCNCTLISSPKLPGTAICNLQQLICAKKVEVDVFSTKPEEVYKECIPRCIDVKYNTKLSQTPYSNDTALRFQKLFNLPEGTLTTVIHVFMEDVSVMVKIRTKKYETWDTVGLFGGIFGFTTGTSFMTVPYCLAAFILMIILIIQWLYKRYQAGLFPFRRQSPDAVNPVEADPNAVVNIASPNEVEDIGDQEMAIFTIRNVPGPDPAPVNRNTVFQYIP